MQTRTTATRGWQDWEDDEDDFEDDRVATVADGFERGAALHGLWIRVHSQAFRSGRAA